MKCVPVGLSWATIAGILLSGAVAPAQEFKAPAGQAPDPEVLKQIREKTLQLDKELTRFRGAGPDPLLPELEVFHHAALNIFRYNEFFKPEFAAWTLEVLDRGLERVKQVENKKFDWIKKTGVTAVRAYRSRLDGSIQPYAVTLPEGYGEDDKKYRIEVVLHGRDASLTEVKFLRAHGSGKAAPKDLQAVRIDIYGRGNNAYRWAGEVDVLEAMANFTALEFQLGRDKYLDFTRWVLRGFSMGGAGTWHLGLHRPDAWCVIQPGAGFTTTHGYVGKLPAKLPDHQEKCLRIYDAVDYAENAFMVPVVAYSGADDPQKKAADNIEARLKQLGLADRMTHVIAPGLKHVPPAGQWQKKIAEAMQPLVEKGHTRYPDRVRFVTYTLKYHHCDWVDILNLERHYERALVDAEKTEDGFKVTTANVRSLRLGTPPKLLHDVTVVIDKQTVTARPWGNKGGPHAVYLQKRDGKWYGVLPERLDEQQLLRPWKAPNMSGPIDDAFTDAFLCVRGTGKPWHAATEKYAEDNLQRFRDEWGKYWRGKLPVKDDADVTREDIKNKHLILFGDPSSNSLIGHALDGLPLTWTKDKITFAGKEVSAADHVPVLIYPNPLNHKRYLVLNSGHTFHAAEYQATNAQLYPRLGDFALLRLAPTAKDALAVETVTAGLFDDDWRIGKR